MELFASPFRELDEYKRASEALMNGKKRILFTDCTESGKLQLLDAFGADFDVQVIVTYDEKRAGEIAEEYEMYRKEVYYFPAKDIIFFQADIYSNDITAKRMKVFRALLEGEQITLVTTPNALMVPLIPLTVLMDNVLCFETGRIAEEKAVRITLNRMGYRKVSIVDAP